LLELLQAARGLPLVVVGDGPLRDLVPDAVGFVPPAEMGGYIQRAAVVACPSRREGYGVSARQAQAFGRPVVASRVGGLVEAVVDGETGLLVAPGDITGLRAALERLLGDAALRRRMGAAARARAEERFGLDAAAQATIAAYEAALPAGTHG
jgi:glycosyltransferase involved in cell wall biosynthesis